MRRALLLMLLVSWVTCCRGACSFPSNLLGDWYSSSFGTLTFTSTSFSGFTSALSVTPLTFTCELSSGTQYASKTGTQLFSGVSVDVYLCMNLQQLSSVKYYFTLDSDRDNGTGIRFYTPSTGDVSLTDICTVTDTRSAGEYEFLILKDNIADAFVTCPSQLLSVYDVIMTTQSVTNCNGTSLEGRSSTSTSVTFNYSSCATGRFNAGGYLTCVYAISSGLVYVNTYNNDTSVDGSSTYRFTCFALSKDEATLYATESPGSCDFGQSATTVNSPGIQYVMTDLLYVADDNYTVIIAVVCSVAFVIIVVILIIVYFKVCRKPKPAPPPKIRKRKRKPSITEYTPRMTRSESAEKDLQVKKKTAGEILTGTLTDKRDAVTDGGGYEPPPKQAWQKNWEAKMRPSTPRTGKSTAETFSDLHRSSHTTSLPENLDITLGTQNKLRKDSVSSTTVSLDDMRYSERAHAITKVPESTGKFGNSPRPRLQDSLISGLDTTLNTIKENPMSRESSATNFDKSAGEHTRRTADLALSNRADNRSLLSTAFTTSTLSARDINITSHSNLSRGSRLSSSNASIFDDPTWLNENTKKTDTFFDVLKNLIPGLPPKQAKDQKWFIKSNVKPAINREDFEYFKNRNSRSVGISKLAGKGSQSSLEIIQNEKKRSSKKRTQTKPNIVRPTSPHFED